MRRWLAVVLVLAMAGVCSAESMRTLFVKENRLPEKGQAEVGSVFRFIDYDTQSAWTEIVDGELVIHSAGYDEEVSATPYVRYGLLDNLTIFGELPYRSLDREVGDDESGVGDAVVGFEAKIYEDIFDYPYVIPHLEFKSETGDEDTGLGTGESTVSVGCSFGTIVADAYHYILDARYEVRDSKDVTTVALAFIWDVSDQLSVLAEGKISDEELGEDGDNPAYLQAGMCYQATEALAINVYGGAGESAPEDRYGIVKVAYSF